MQITIFKLASLDMVFIISLLGRLRPFSRVYGTNLSGGSGGSGESIYKSMVYPFPTYSKNKNKVGEVGKVFIFHILSKIYMGFYIDQKFYTHLDPHHLDFLA